MNEYVASETRSDRIMVSLNVFFFVFVKWIVKWNQSWFVRMHFAYNRYIYYVNLFSLLNILLPANWLR